MPAGVTDSFLDMLEREWRARARLLVASPFLAGACLFLAELADHPPYGPFVRFTGGALAAGFAVGLAASWWRFRRATASLRERWAKWMQWSYAADSVGRLHAKVREARSPPAWLWGAAWGAGVLANVVLFVALWYAWGFRDHLATLVLLVDGLAVGALAADAAWGAQWARRLRGACRELVEEGQVGVWGER